MQESPFESEQLCYEFLMHLESSRHDRLAALLALGARSDRLDPGALTQTARALVRLSDASGAQLLKLPDGRYLLFFERHLRRMIEESLGELRVGIGSEAVSCRWLDVENAFSDIVELVRKAYGTTAVTPITQSPRASRPPFNPSRRPPKAFSPEDLESVLGVLAQVDIANFIRRRTVCRIAGTDAPKPLFVEFAIAVEDLAATMLPGVDLTVNAWVTAHLVHTLNRRILAMIARPDSVRTPGRIGIGLTVSTLLSDEFAAFEDQLVAGRRGTIVIDLTATDILADVESYLFARRFLRARGYQVCVSGLNDQSVGFIDRARLGVDLVRINRTDEPQPAASLPRRLSAAREKIGAQHFILGQIDTAENLATARECGVELFQGPFVEQLVREEQRRQALLDRHRPHGSRRPG